MSEIVKVAKKTQKSMFEDLILRFFYKIKYGCIHFNYDGNYKVFGDLNHKLHAEIVILDNNFFDKIFWNGSVGFAEAYILGYWETNDLAKLLRIITLNINVVDNVDSFGWGMLFRAGAKLLHYFRKNTVPGAKKNIAKHYDLGNNFFSLFLDPSMMYSAAKFDAANNTLDLASENKLLMICKKLQLKDSDHVLEIGAGWGGFAIYAAVNYGCRVTTTTISKQQFDYVQAKINNLGLQQQITLLMQDYRDLTGEYDKLVSIEMIEAVGANYLGVYIKKCSDLLKPNGIFVMQAITISEQRYIAARDSVDFIKKYIFPGGFLPSVGEIMRYLRSDSDFNLLNLEDLTLDYAKTLQLWRERFIRNYNKIISSVSDGFDELFMRKWEYYFSYCEAGFRERYIYSLQFKFNKPGYRD